MENIGSMLQIVCAKQRQIPIPERAREIVREKKYGKGNWRERENEKQCYQLNRKIIDKMYGDAIHF